MFLFQSVKLDVKPAVERQRVVPYASMVMGGTSTKCMMSRVSVSHLSLSQYVHTTFCTGYVSVAAEISL